MDVAKKIQEEIIWASQEGNIDFQNCNFPEINVLLFCKKFSSKSAPRENQIVLLPATSTGLFFTVLVSLVAIGGLVVYLRKGSNEAISIQNVPKKKNKKGMRNKTDPNGEKNVATKTSASIIQEIKEDALPKSAVQSVQLLSKTFPTSPVKIPKFPILKQLPLMEESRIVEMEISPDLSTESQVLYEVPEPQSQEGRILLQSYDKDGKKGLLRFDDNSFYMGDLDGLQRHGNGLHLRFSPSKMIAYEGDWKNDKREGSGNFYTNSFLHWSKATWKNGALDTTKKITTVINTEKQKCIYVKDSGRKVCGLDGSIEEEFIVGDSLLNIFSDPTGKIRVVDRSHNNPRDYRLNENDMIIRKIYGESGKQEVRQRKLDTADCGWTKINREGEKLEMRADSYVEFSGNKETHLAYNGNYNIRDCDKFKIYLREGNFYSTNIALKDV
eukprot:GHVP01006084.1.p1 GENE.GHVP01006084.1~~GHVP01006084.1.p1  ORF type:complete len:448 (+),score=79.40 GHVP01006084.1:23-1345(+)